MPAAPRRAAPCRDNKGDRLHPSPQTPAATADQPSGDWALIHDCARRARIARSAPPRPRGRGRFAGAASPPRCEHVTATRRDGTSGRYLTNFYTPGTLTFTFTTAVSAVGFNWGAADQAWRMQVFDLDNVLLSTLNIAAQTAASNYAGFIGASGNGSAIGSVKLTSVGSTDWVMIDNLRTVAANVPEPGSLALAGLGLALAIGASRRRKLATQTAPAV